MSLLLFNLYANDPANNVPVSLFQYADETVIVARAKKYTDAITAIQMAAIKAID